MYQYQPKPGRKPQGQDLVHNATCLRIRPGDVLIYRCERELSDAVADRVVATLGQAFPGVKVLLLDGGASVSVGRMEVAKNLADYAVDSPAEDPKEVAQATS